MAGNLLTQHISKSFADLIQGSGSNNVLQNGYGQYLTKITISGSLEATSITGSVNAVYANTAGSAGSSAVANFAFTATSASFASTSSLSTRLPITSGSNALTGSMFVDTSAKRLYIYTGNGTSAGWAYTSLT
jgi:hypothetical protein